MIINRTIFFLNLVSQSQVAGKRLRQIDDDEWRWRDSRHQVQNPETHEIKHNYDWLGKGKNSAYFCNTINCNQLWRLWVVKAKDGIFTVIQCLEL